MSVTLKGSVRQGRLVLDIDIVVGDEIVAISGVNGIGKTTLLRVLAGLLPLDAGILQVNENVLDDSDHQLFGMWGWYFKTMFSCHFCQHSTMLRIRFWQQVLVGNTLENKRLLQWVSTVLVI